MSNTLQLPKPLPVAKPVRSKREHSSAGDSGSGVVAYYVKGPKGGFKDFTVAKLVEVLQHGLPLREFTDLQTGLNIPAERLAPMIGISKATLHRRLRSAGQRLEPAESDQVVRFARLLGKAITVFGGVEDARQWLDSPQSGLGGAVPLEFAKTEVGGREVENLLGRIEYGVYS